MNWDDPRARAALYRALGRIEFERQYQAHLAESVVETVNGYPIRTSKSRLSGMVYYTIVGLGFSAPSLEEARAYANAAPPRIPAGRVKPVTPA